MSAPVVPVQHITEEKIITGEAVELDIHPASPILRMAARIVDMVVACLTTFFLLSLLAPLMEGLSPSMQRFFAIAFFSGLFFFVPFIVELLTRGLSLGKWAFGIQVVRDDGGTVTARHVLVRTLAAIIEIWLSLGSIAIVSVIVSPKGKRLGDIAAGTTVIALPTPTAHHPLLMPPELSVWAASAQILPLPHGLQAQALSYLRSNRALAPAIRASVATSLAAQVAHRVSPPPPANTHPERFLAAVLVILRDRQFFRSSEREIAAAKKHALLDNSQWGI